MTHHDSLGIVTSSQDNTSIFQSQTKSLKSYK